MNVLPSYLSRLSHKELQNRIEHFANMYLSCISCPHMCNVNRIEGSTGVCKTNAQPFVSSYGPHFGEESALVGRSGSGTIFFGNCNLSCVYCQNFDISQNGEGHYISYKELAKRMIHLQNRGCHNINFVSPTHQIYQILKALYVAIDDGLIVPLVYNSGGYDSVNIIKKLNGIFDIYMPDFKYYDTSFAYNYSGVKDYQNQAITSLVEMYNQVGNLEVNEHGIASKGILIRHLVLPGLYDQSKLIIELIANEVSSECTINLMDQYRPAYHAHEHSMLNQTIDGVEYRRLIEYALSLGLNVLNN